MNTEDFKEFRSPRTQSRLGKLRLLLWKNLHLRRRHWVLTLFELVIPVGLMLLVVYLRAIPNSALLPKKIEDNTIFQPYSETLLKEYVCDKSLGHWNKAMDKCNYVDQGLPGDRRLFWGPPNDFTKGIIDRVQSEISFHDSYLVNVSSNDELNKLVQSAYFESNQSLTAFYIGIFFNLDDPTSDEPPLELNYDLRLQKYWFTSYVYPFIQLAGPRNFTGNKSESDSGNYVLDGFSLLQTLIDRAFMIAVSNEEEVVNNITLETEMYPYPPYTQDYGMGQFYGALLPTFIVLSLILLSPTLIKSIVYEKETGVRELIRMMGLEGWLIWLGWFFYSFMTISVVCIISTVLMKVDVYSPNVQGGKLPAVLVYSDGTLICFMLLLYGISAICFCFAISCFFSKPTLATTIGVLAWLLTYTLPRSAVDNNYSTMTLGSKLFSCILPNIALTLFFKITGMFEGRALGVRWSNLWDTGNPRDNLTPGMVLLMLIFDIFFYAFITWYVDQVMPGIYGVPRPWYFLFQKSYWFRSERKENDEESLLGETTNSTIDYSSYVEEEPLDLKTGIKIRALRKEFKSGKKVKVAVDHVDLTCFEGQCTVLLGHNGAGKTTTMSVLTGVYTPSGGSAVINGWNIKTHLKEARSQVGLCPQHNTLFTDLTVKEHLLFFARLKGLNPKEANEEANALLERLQLGEKEDQFGGQLSGGMKRKLCLAIALIGGSRVIILDEPSSGLDPESRRWVWDVVQQERGSRTVLVTTHHMEEADVLGDRVAIMADGRIVCSGSSLFLKNTFGDGYTLSVIGNEEIQSSKVKEIVCGHLENASMRSSDGKIFLFKLPSETEKFPKLLDQLTKEKQELGIDHLGLSLTTMEQVFLRVGEIVDCDKKKAQAILAKQESIDKGRLNLSFEASNGNGLKINSENSNIETVSNASIHNYREHKLQGKNLLFGRLGSLWKKKYIYSKRKWILLLTQALIPVVVTILCLASDASFNQQNFLELPIELNKTMYAYSYSSVESHNDLDLLRNNYMSLFSDPYQVDTTNDTISTLLEASSVNLNVYRENYVTSAVFNKTDDGKLLTRMLYQSVPYHSNGIGINLINNALLKTLKPELSYSIQTNNAPLPRSNVYLTTNNQSSLSSVIYALVMPLALAFLTASFLVFPLQERVSNSKQIQLMTGTPSFLLWCTTYTWDLLTYIASALLIFFFFMVMDTKNYFTVDGAAGALFLLLLLYGIGSIPMAYVFSFFFKTSASGFAVLALVNIIAGQIITSVTLAFDLVGTENLLKASNIIGNITSFVPSYPASKAFMYIVETSTFNTMCQVVDPSVVDDLCKNLEMFVPDSPYMPCCPNCNATTSTCFKKFGYLQWSFPGIGMYLMYFVVDAIFYFLLLYFIEIGLWDTLFKRCYALKRRWFPTKQEEFVHEEVDDDVRREKRISDELMQEKTTEGSSIVVQDLTKVFMKVGVYAVKGISFHVKKGECFGLLGVNGAGKTTTFRMLTGDEIPTSGDARIGMNFLSQGRKKFMEEIGYCPQFDAIIGELTGEEMLALMAGLRGVPRQAKPQLIQRLVTLVDLTECAKRPSDTYSGGNKRKLSTAMALVGQPPLVFLDEPTSGVDPASRRRVWEAVTDATRCGQSVILTSHSMDECEALCSRVVIMAKGTLKCIGSPQHLKAKYGQGYTLQVKTKSSLSKTECLGLSNIESEKKYNEKINSLKEVIPHLLEESVLTDEHRGMLSYRVPSTISWSKLFNVMEALKLGNDLPDISNLTTTTTTFNDLIEDYAAMDPSLEQVFLSFARDTYTKSKKVSECETTIL